MNAPDPRPPDFWLMAAFLLGIWTSVVVWVAFLARAWQGKALCRYQPRRAVPWQAADLLLVLLIYLLLQMAMFSAARVWLGPEVLDTKGVNSAEAGSSMHVIGRLVAEGNVWILAVCAFSAVIVAPIGEEFLFRVLLQGYLESLWRRWRRKLPTLSLVPAGVGPIVLTSLLFARMHFRADQPELETNVLLALLVGGTMATLLTTVAAVVLLRYRTGATAVDLGWVSRKLGADFAMAAVCFIAVVPLIFAMQMFLTNLLPKNVAADPIPLFFLSLALGTLYFFTHRAAPSIFVHMLLNGTSLLMAWQLLG